MTYPFDQISTLAKANGQLALALAQIARDSTETYAQIGGKAATAVFDQIKALKPGTAPAFSSEPLTGLLGAFEKDREASLAKVRAAFDEWQGVYREAVSQAAAGQQEFVDSARALFAQQTTTSTAQPDKTAKKSSAEPTSAKPADAA